MWTLVLVVVFAGSAAAEPANRKVLPSLGSEETWLDRLGLLTHDKTTGALAIDGGRATGIVIDPGPHLDARPYPRGMVIAPPDPRDHNVLVPGTMSLPGPARTWTERMFDWLNFGVGSVLDLVLPGPRL
jgi:hypothetical protein